MKIIFVNGKGGRAKRRGQLAYLLGLLRAMPDTHIHIIAHGDDVPALVRRAVEEGAELVAAAGGDGTLNSVASGLVGTDTPLGIIPFGTLNHFARDVGVPFETEKAVALLSKGGVRKAIDVGEVNGRIFLNNSSIGIYPYLVRVREQYEGKLGKALAYGVAAFSFLQHPNAPRQQIRAVLDGREVVPQQKVGLVFVANNKCDIGLPRPGTRDCLDGSVLDIYTLQVTNRFDMVRVAVSYLTSKEMKSSLVDNYTARDMRITLPHLVVRVACDGEVFRTRAPLHYTNRPGALQVWIPAGVVLTPSPSPVATGEGL